MYLRKINSHIASALIVGPLTFLPSVTMAMHHGKKDAAQAVVTADIVDTAVAACRGHSETGANVTT